MPDDTIGGFPIQKGIDFIRKIALEDLICANLRYGYVWGIDNTRLPSLSDTYFIKTLPINSEGMPPIRLASICRIAASARQVTRRILT